MDSPAKITTTGSTVFINDQADPNADQAGSAFGKQAPLFDQLYNNDTIIQYKRMRVRTHVEKLLSSGSSILELNAGTGEDAIYFARRGHMVHSTDISEGMRQIFLKKVKEHELEKCISHELCSFTELDKLQKQGPYDHIFSNFAGLNCTGRLDKVLSSFNWLLKPGGTATIVILPKFCLWEFLLLFKGKFKTAFRRFSGKKGTRAHIEGEYFRCWYYNPSYIIKLLSYDFDKVGLEGLCTLVPPSYMEGFSKKHPRMYKSLVERENKWKRAWPWRSVGDYYIISFRKKMM
jgi:ubiquinone/menaquinone biosynthesis C-methylase UbiE